MRLAQKILGQWFLPDPISDVTRLVEGTNAQCQTSRAGLRRQGTKVQLVGGLAFEN